MNLKTDSFNSKAILINASISLLVGMFLSKQWILAETFDGKDFTGRVLSLVLLFTIFFLSKRISIQTSFLIPLFIGLSFFHERILLKVYLESNYPDIIYFIVLTIYLLLSTSILQVESSSKRQVLHLLLPLSVGLCTGLLVYSDWTISLITGAAVLIILFKTEISQSLLKASSFLILSICIFISVTTTPAQASPRQGKYFDPVVSSFETSLRKYDITHWKGNYWFFADGHNQFSTADSWLYFEPLVHPVMSHHEQPKNILVIGGENGMAISELLKYDIARIDLLPIDSALVQFSKSHPLLSKFNAQSLESKNVHVKSHDIFRTLSQGKVQYDVIIVDLPDPKSLLINQFYTTEFYELCYQKLEVDGLLVTQAGSPYFATRSFFMLEETLRKSGLHTLRYHNQIMTIGEWGWVIGSKKPIEEQAIIDSFKNGKISTKWLNQEAIKMMFSFGKPQIQMEGVEVNSLKNPILFRAYSKGNWQL